MIDAKKFNSIIKRAVEDKAFLRKLAKEASQIIYRRVKIGKGVNNDQSQSPKAKKLQPLSRSYIAWRKGQVAFFEKDGSLRAVPKGKNFTPAKPSLGPFGSATRSNLTLSGQMLESIKTQVLKRTIRIFIPDTPRKPVTRFDKSRKTNAEVANYVSEKRPFFALTAPEQRILNKKMVDHVKRELRRKF